MVPHTNLEQKYLNHLSFPGLLLNGIVKPSIHEVGQVLDFVFIITVGIKTLTRIQLRLSHLNKHRYNHKFKNCMNPNCSCSSENDLTVHFFCIAIFTFKYKLKDFYYKRKLPLIYKNSLPKISLKFYYFAAHILLIINIVKLLKFILNYTVDSMRFTD